MLPQDRTRAILQSKVELSLRMVLVVLADAMLDTRETCWLSVETIAERAGLCERQTREVLNSAEERGLIRRWNGDHKSRDIAIEWGALAAAEGSKSARGGARPAKTAAQPAKTAGDSTGKDCHPDRQSLPPQPAKTAENTGKDCPRSGKEAGSEAGSEAGTRASPPAKPPVDFDHLWAALTAFTPKPGAWKLTPERRKHLAARVADHGEAAVYRVAEWVRTSPHDRAAFLRDRGDVSTLLRPEKFATYAAFSDGPAQRTPHNDGDAPLRRGELFLMPRPHDAREGAIDIPYEAP